MTALVSMPELDDLERHAAAHRLLLLGHVDDAAAAFADLLEQFVAADAVAHSLRRGRAGPFFHEPLAQKGPGLLMRFQEGEHEGVEILVRATRIGQELAALVRIGPGQGVGKELPDPASGRDALGLNVAVHRIMPGLCFCGLTRRRDAWEFGNEPTRLAIHFWSKIAA